MRAAAAYRLYAGKSRALSRPPLPPTLHLQLTISREEGFSTPKESHASMAAMAGGSDMILAPMFAIMFVLQVGL